MKSILSPSILAANFATLGADIKAAETAGVDALHIDVMDGLFVPNISFGFVVLEAIKPITNLPLDVHLMIEKPERYIEAFAKAGATGLTVHPEATPHIHRALQQIRDAGLRVGMAINPGTPLDVFADLLPDLDLALLMTINPGFGGQKFLPMSKPRLAKLAHMRDQLNPKCEIQLDGGVTTENAAELLALGANNLVAGTAVFKGDIAANVAHFKTLMR